jgi:acyl-CoA oxidase
MGLQEALDGRWAHVRQAARTQLAGPRFVAVPGETLEQARERIGRLITELPADPGIAAGFPIAYGGSADPGGSVVAAEMLAQIDLSLMVKAGVQWGLFGGAVVALGTRRHHDAYLRDIISADLLGCFAMTETGHGSDVQQLRTTCTYDPDTETFDLHTPHEAARKDYIGNAARDGRMAVVFAQLSTGGRQYGVHAWLVPIRDEQGRPMPGVTIGDDGAKAGLIGVDNGRLSFDHVPVPRDMLLDRYGQVAPDGTYTSSIENDVRRFFTMLGTLVRGRVVVGGSASAATKSALTIAVRYGDIRRQFTAPGEPREIVLNDYLAHQRILLTARPRRTPCTSPRRSWSPSCTRCRPRTARSTSTASASWSRGRPPSRSRRPGTPPAPSRPAERPLAGPATSPRTGCPGSRRTPTCSPPSRATTRSCCSWSPRACSPATATRSARSTAGAGRPSSPSRCAPWCWSAPPPVR